MAKFGITDQLIADQQAHIQELDNMINLAEQGEYDSRTPAPQDPQERKAYIGRLKEQLKHSEDVLIALQNNFDGVDAD